MRTLLLDDAVRDAREALERLLDEEIDLNDLTEADEERLRGLAGLCAEFSMHLNAA